MLFNGKHAFFVFLLIFHVIQWEVCILSIFHVIQWEFEAWETLGGVHTYRRLEIHPCVLQDNGPLGPLPKKAKGDRRGQRSPFFPLSSQTFVIKHAWRMFFLIHFLIFFSLFLPLFIPSLSGPPSSSLFRFLFWFFLLASFISSHSTSPSLS